MSPAPVERGSGVLPFCWIVLPVTVVSFDEPNPNGFSTTPMPTVLLLVTLLSRIVTSWPPTLRIPVPDGSSCRSSSSSRCSPGRTRRSAAVRRERVRPVVLVDHVASRSARVRSRSRQAGQHDHEDAGRVSLSLLPRTIESSVLSSSMPISPFVRLLPSTRDVVVDADVDRRVLAAAAGVFVDQPVARAAREDPVLAVVDVAAAGDLEAVDRIRKIPVSPRRSRSSGR